VNCSKQFPAPNAYKPKLEINPIGKYITSNFESSLVRKFPK